MIIALSVHNLYQGVKMDRSDTALFSAIKTIEKEKYPSGTYICFTDGDLSYAFINYDVYLNKKKIKKAYDKLFKGGNIYTIIVNEEGDVIV